MNYNRIDYEDIDFLMSQKYYHGTSDIFDFDEDIVLPSRSTGNTREKKSNLVWVTTSKGSAEKYAFKAADKFGGHPIVYEVEPDWDTLAHRMDFEYTCYFAYIEKII